MNFQDLHTIEKPDFYLDLAFRKASDRVEKAREKKSKTRIDKSKFIESTRIQAVAGILQKHMQKIIESYPSIDQLPEFYNKLIKITLDYPMLKKSLGSVGWIDMRVQKLTSEYTKKIMRCREMENINKYRREYYGRVSSMMKQIKSQLSFLEQARRIMRGFPHIKTSLRTVSIAGFPNVGKTTLLYKLTGSKPEINNYAFTTKNINVAYFKEDNKKIQLLDTPGTLDRLNKMNYIEHQAHLAIELCAHMIIYVFDLTLTYPIKDQIKLYEKTLEYGLPTLIYFSKEDLLEKEEIAQFAKDYKNTFSNPKELKKKIIEMLPDEIKEEKPEESD